MILMIIKSSLCLSWTKYMKKGLVAKRIIIKMELLLEIIVSNIKKKENKNKAWI